MPQQTQKKQKGLSERSSAVNGWRRQAMQRRSREAAEWCERRLSRAGVVREAPVQILGSDERLLLGRKRGREASQTAAAIPLRYLHIAVPYLSDMWGGNIDLIITEIQITMKEI